MAVLEIRTEQVLDLIQQLPLNSKHIVIEALKKELEDTSENDATDEESETWLACVEPVMTSASDGQTSIIRTERGLTISGTRVTLYDVMDYLGAQYPIKFIRSLFDLSKEQIAAAIAYIEANHAEVEAEYQQVLNETEELQKYYEEQNRERVAQIAMLPPPPGLEAAWEKLQASKARHQLHA